MHIEEINLVDWFAWRADVYLFLATLYQTEPSAVLLKTVAEGQLLTALFGDIPAIEVQENCHLLENTVSLYEQDLRNYQQELQVEFNGLFIGPGHLPTPPWESVYRSKERLMFGEQTMVIRDIYQSFGFWASQKTFGPEDHVALELEFMAQLCKRGEEGLAGVDRLLVGQKRFLADHLLEWMPAFCADIVMSASSDFYRGLAGLTVGWLKADDKQLSAILK